MLLCKNKNHRFFNSKNTLSMSIKKTFITKAKWPAPANVFACTTTLHLGNFSFNGNPTLSVTREKLKKKLSLTVEPFWIQQVHGNTVLDLDNIESNALISADGSYTQQPNQICTIITADCLPILICSMKGDELAAIHAGWRSLLAGVIENGIALFKSKPHHLLAWLGPAISAQFFIVGDDVYNQFISKNNQFANAFTQITPKHFHCNLYTLAKQHLKMQGITHIYHDNYCTYKDKKLFYSYRRQHDKAGRMATLIWRNT